MFVKLAFRNVCRQLNSYLIYFLTVSLTVAMMFSFCNVIFSERMVEMAALLEQMKGGLIAVTVLMSLVVSFILGYADSFMLRLRKKEFGTCMTLGMTRKQVVRLFLTENLFLSILSLLSGIVLGLFLYQMLMGVAAGLMETGFVWGDYSVKGLTVTIVIVGIMFLLSSVTSSVYIRRVSIYNLVNSQSKSVKSEKASNLVVFWSFVSVISIASMFYGCLLFRNMLNEIFSGRSGDMKSIVCMMGSFSLLTGGIFFFHVGMAKSLTGVMLMSKKLCACGTNTFLIRQLGNRLKSNSVICGILAVLLSFAVIGANVSFGQKVTNAAALDNEHPFDVTVSYPFYAENAAGGFELSNSKAEYFMSQENCIRQVASILETYQYDIYTSGSNMLFGSSPWSGEGYRGLTDCYLKVSDFNSLMNILGRPEVSCDKGVLILAESKQACDSDLKNACVILNGEEYHVFEVTDQYPVLSQNYFIAVVPDSAVAGMQKVTETEVIMLDHSEIDALSLNTQMFQIYEAFGVTDGTSPDYREPQIREYYRNDANSLTMLFVISELYVSLLCVMMALAILALKNLTGIAEDSRRYHILYCIGTSRKVQADTLFRQHASFFFLPYPFAMLLSVPSALLAVRIMKYNGFNELTGTVIQNAVVIAVCFSILYILFFLATYQIAKKSLFTA